MFFFFLNFGCDWKILVDKMGFFCEEILFFDCRKDFVFDLISVYESKGKIILELLFFLEEMERFDLIDDF